MEIRELVYLVTLADEGNISRAAERLYMAQSSLSHFIKQIEAELNTTLFLRSPRGIHLTPAGELFISHARNMLQELQVAKNEIYELENMLAGTIHLGISTYRGTYILPHVLKQFQSRYPKVSVTVTELTSALLEHEILNGSLDMALVSLPLKVLEPQNVTCRIQDEVKLIAAPGHPVLSSVFEDSKTHEPSIPVSALEGQTFIYHTPVSALGRLARSLFHQYDVHPKAYPSDLSPLLASAVVRTGSAVTFFSESLRSYAPELHYLSLVPEKQFVELTIVYSRSGHTSKACRILGDMFAHWQSYQSQP